jgi:hypothetical protein
MTALILSFRSSKIFCVWQNVVDARCIFFLKLKTHVDDNDVVFVFDHGHVAADFFDASKRNNANIANQIFDFDRAKSGLLADGMIGSSDALLFCVKLILRPICRIRSCSLRQKNFFYSVP